MLNMTERRILELHAQGCSVAEIARRTKKKPLSILKLFLNVLDEPPQEALELDARLIPPPEVMQQRMRECREAHFRERGLVPGSPEREDGLRTWPQVRPETVSVAEIKAARASV